jgi:hypothetical protein
MLQQSKAVLLLVSAVVLALVAACGSPAAPTATPVPQGPQLRITNSGSVPIEGLVVLFPEDRVEFGDVARGETTVYRDVPNGVYNYAAYEFVVNGETVTQPVIDWVGESPRPGQAFTYVLDFDPNRDGEMFAMQLVQATVDR